MIWLSLALAAEPIYRECDISVGQVRTCKATSFTGTAPIERSNGRVYLCDLSVGEGVGCGMPYSGETVLLRGTKYVRCEVASGFVSRCDATGFTGLTVTLQ